MLTAMPSATRAPDSTRPAPAPDDAAAASPPWLVVWVAAERFAVPLATVREMIEWPVVVAERALPPSAVGVTAGRDGRVVLWSGAQALGQRAADPAGLALVLDGAAGPTGLVADRVADVMTIPDSAIRALPTLDDPGRIVLGVARDEVGLITMLDAARLTRALPGLTEVA